MRTSNFGAEAFLLIFFSDLNLKTFLTCSEVTWYSISINQRGSHQETDQSALFAVVLSSYLSHACAACSVAANKMSRQPTLGKFGFTTRLQNK